MLLPEVGCCAQVWDSQALTCLRTLEGHEDNVRVLAVGDSYVFSGSWDKSIRSALCRPLAPLPSSACLGPLLCGQPRASQRKSCAGELRVQSKVSSASPARCGSFPS